MIDRSHESGQETEASPGQAIDFAFLRRQTFGDAALERELLQLFVAQARRVVASLPSLPVAAQSDAAHLLKGSARGIGAFAAADLADAYEAEVASRDTIYVTLASAFDRATAVISAHLEAC